MEAAQLYKDNIKEYERKVKVGTVSPRCPSSALYLPGASSPVDHRNHPNSRRPVPRYSSPKLELTAPQETVESSWMDSSDAIEEPSAVASGSATRTMPVPAT